MIRYLVFRNAMCFRGTHRIVLEAKAYAITARFEDDAQRSNTGGKSAILELIDLVLQGKLRKEREFDADGWITWGEAEGEIIIGLEGDAVASVSKKRGRSTQVSFSWVVPGEKLPAAGTLSCMPARVKDGRLRALFHFPAADGREAYEKFIDVAEERRAVQDEARAAIRAYLRLDEQDYRNAVYFEQRQMARLIHADPSKRIDVVSGWFGLGVADRLDAEAGEYAAEKAKVLGDLLDKRRRAKEDAGDEAEKGPDLGALDAEEHELSEALRKIRVAIAQTAIRRIATQQVEAYANLVAEGSAAVESRLVAREALQELLNCVGDLVDDPNDRRSGIVLYREEQEARVAAHSVALAEVRALRVVAAGEFDGRCPVADLACPATMTINENRLASGRKLAEADRSLKKHVLGIESGAKYLDQYERLQARFVDEDRKLESLRDRAREAKVIAREAKKTLETAAEDPGDYVTRVPELERLHRVTLERRAEANAAERRREAARETVIDLTKAIEAATREADLAARTVGVFTVARRRVIERALAVIGVDATRMLADVGVPVEIGFRWEREGKDPAKACERCGAAFPASRKVKECERCGAERGMNVIQRLDPVISTRSAGADDLAGVLLQLAAASWLLRTRESPFATALLDEPFAHLDARARKGLARAIAKAVLAGSFRQALVISHDPAVTTSFPGRIEIIIARDGTRRIEVT